MKDRPTLDQLYREVAARKKRRERIAMIAFMVIGSVAVLAFVVSLLTPQP